ncbi:metallo-beta-lactamase superfamily protein [Oleiphilus messinensis]|uniref:Hydroxyacylglutathione hydrolase n=1 Tax=Oleiphilus messinensis TaxID=141451 RepID=A0A1Y0ICH9_9GAMM|nr:hydroxyacylglutathione hydrolase [Oleiphilus messinensis]ARU57083.1 metallo-beta-lactamase superfamily protein [Oleiphilus messinensis]
MIKITPIPAFNDNYIWALIDQENGAMAVVDPGDAKPVLAFAKNNKLTLTTILLTHHHFDHVGGVKQLVAEFNCPVYAGHQSKYQPIDHALHENDSFTLFGLEFNVIEVPGHTLDHIAYFSDSLDYPVLFCGDTLFSAGCGRLFEGSPETMFQSLAKLKALPEETAIYCTHEYTLANLDFAKTVAPENTALKQYIERCEHQRQNDMPTLPSSIKTELAINPFLRTSDPEVAAAAATQVAHPLASDVDVFTAIRSWKDRF